MAAQIEHPSLSPMVAPSGSGPINPLSIAFVIPSFAGGGAERVMLQLASHLDRERFKPIVIVLEDTGPLRGELATDVTVLNLRTPTLRNAVGLLHRLFTELKPDIVFSTMGFLNIGVIFANFGRIRHRPRIVIREANIPEATFEAFRVPFLIKAAYRYLYRYADAVICNAQLVRDKLGAAGVQKDIISVLPNPIEINRLRQLAASKIRSRQRDHFVASGRLVPQKGFDRLLEWFADYPGEGPMTIFGEGPQRRELTDLSKRLGLSERVKFPGFEEHPWQSIADADAFLLPSRWEGMPNAALEALALGTPVVACREAGGIEEIASIASNGAVLLADDKDSFLAAMGAVPPRGDVNNLRASLLPEEYSLASVVLLYQEILGGELSANREL